MTNKIHFIGIGGVSMSKLAALYHLWGYEVSGSDAAFSPVIDMLISRGINAYVGINPSIAASADVVVYSSAINPSNEERVVARVAMERRELLSIIEKQFNQSIAVSGAHGKTTMSGMLSWVLMSMGESIHAHVGGDVIGIDSLGLEGYNTDSSDNTLVIEACEYKRSFLCLRPQYSVVLNVDFDHPDCYRDIEDVYTSFAQFVANTSRIAFLEYKCSSKLLSLVGTKHGGTDADIITFGDNANANYYIMNCEVTDGGSTADVYKHGMYYGNITINIHNPINLRAAIAVIAVLDTLGFNPEHIMAGIKSFKGVSRRFEYIGMTKGESSVYTDYAHHPQEISTMLTCYNKLPNKGRKILVFQPHTYSRTKALLPQFVSALRHSEICYILPTYSAREQPKDGLAAYDLYDMLRASGYNNSHYLCDNEELKLALDDCSEQDVIMLCGAGIDYKGILNILNK